MRRPARSRISHVPAFGYAPRRSGDQRHIVHGCGIADRCRRPRSAPAADDLRSSSPCMSTRNWRRMCGASAPPLDLGVRLTAPILSPRNWPASASCPRRRCECAVPASVAAVSRGQQPKPTRETPGAKYRATFFGRFWGLLTKYTTSIAATQAEHRQRLVATGKFATNAAQDARPASNASHPLGIAHDTAKFGWIGTG